MQEAVIDLRKVVNVASVPHRSPFRYPGGKTWFVPYARHWLRSKSKPVAEFAEPFAGGAIVGLSVLFDGLAESLSIVELDKDVAAVWRTILNGKGKRLAERISEFDVSYEAVRETLDQKSRSLFDRAFATIIRNRMQRGGIMAPGASLMKTGENGKGLLSRWYPDTLKRRILEIAAHKKRISFIQGDGIQFIADNARRKNIAFFIDPPYTVAGRRLYSHSEIDHDELFRVVSSVKGDFLMTYDNADAVRQLARKYDLETREVVMKNTHHSLKTELLIGRDFAWLD